MHFVEAGIVEHHEKDEQNRAQPKGGQGALYWVKVDEDVQTPFPEVQR